MASHKFAQRNYTILVVDDSSEMQQYLCTLLEIDCYQVVIVGSGTEALQLVREGFSPDLVILDLQMPGMDGLSTLRHLRKIAPELKVIMCSGNDDPVKMDRATALGAQDYLLKPVKHLYLSAAVERCLSARAAGGHNVLELPVRRSMN